jgi:hypothetical protein
LLNPTTGAGITVSTMVSMNPQFRDFGNFTVEVIVWLVLSAVCDIVIAIGMTHALVCLFLPLVHPCALNGDIVHTQNRTERR